MSAHRVEILRASSAVVRAMAAFGAGRRIVHSHLEQPVMSQLANQGVLT